jgi:hypothetical protein
MPTDEEVDEFESAIHEKYPALRNCWSTMDGLKLLLKRAGEMNAQNNFFNGWILNQYVSNLFFNPDRSCYINAPGTFHDSTIYITTSL